MQDWVTVKKYMKKVTVTLRPEMEVQEAVAILFKHHLSFAPVVDEKGALVGILTEWDCLESFINEEYYDSPTDIVSDLMASDIMEAAPNMSIFQAAELMIRHKFKQMPVLENNQLVGVISRKDVIRAFLEMQQKLAGRFHRSVDI